MSCYIRWLAQRFDEVLPSGHDHPELYNAQVFKNLTFEEADHQTRESGQRSAPDIGALSRESWQAESQSRWHRTSFKTRVASI